MSRTGIAAPNRAAADAAAAIASAGGNAVDAAIAATLVACVNEPGICAAGGGAYVTLWPSATSPRSGPPLTIDGNVAMPGRGADPERFDSGYFEITTAYGGGVTMTIGYGSVGVPGMLAALGRANEDFGRAPWAELLAPASEVAREGFPMGRASSYYLDYVHQDLYGWHPTSRAVIHDDDGALIPTGGLVRIPELADTFDHLAEDGWRSAYVGDLGKVIADDVQSGGGLLTRQDLEAYEAVTRDALVGRLGPWRLATNPPPAIGGVTLLAMLRLMDGHSTDDEAGLRRLVAVQDAVLGYRIRHVDGARDPDRVLGVLLELSQGELEELAEVARGDGPTSPSTIHTSVVSGDGTAAAVTASAGYGSGVMVPGTGMWMNNCLGEHELNVRGVHSLPVGARLASNMAPTVGQRDDGAVLAIGSPGADRITTAIQQVMVAMVAGHDLEDAIRHPRLHVRHLEEGSVVSHEQDLELPGLDLPARPEHPMAMFFGGVGAVVRDAAGAIRVGADPRRTGDTAVTSA